MDLRIERVECGGFLIDGQRLARLEIPFVADAEAVHGRTVVGIDRERFLKCLARRQVVVLVEQDGAPGDISFRELGIEPQRFIDFGLRERDGFGRRAIEVAHALHVRISKPRAREREPGIRGDGLLLVFHRAFCGVGSALQLIVAA